MQVLAQFLNGYPKIWYRAEVWIENVRSEREKRKRRRRRRRRGPSWESAGAKKQQMSNLLLSITPSSGSSSRSNFSKRKNPRLLLLLYWGSNLTFPGDEDPQVKNLKFLSGNSVHILRHILHSFYHFLNFQKWLHLRKVYFRMTPHSRESWLIRWHSWLHGFCRPKIYRNPIAFRLMLRQTCRGGFMRLTSCCSNISQKTKEKCFSSAVFPEHCVPNK